MDHGGLKRSRAMPYRRFRTETVLVLDAYVLLIFDTSTTLSHFFPVYMNEFTTVVL